LNKFAFAFFGTGNLLFYMNDDKLLITGSETKVLNLPALTVNITKAEPSCGCAILSDGNYLFSRSTGLFALDPAGTALFTTIWDAGVYSPSPGCDFDRIEATESIAYWMGEDPTPLFEKIAFGALTNTGTNIFTKFVP